MKRMLVIVPTRGRPESMARLEKARRDTETSGQVDFLYAADTDDPAALEYARISQGMQGWPRRAWVSGWDGTGPIPDAAQFQMSDATLAIAPRMRMVGTLNFHARRMRKSYDYLGFMGDDHVPRTPGWDQAVLDALDSPEPRVVYGNDLLQGANLPTAVFMHAGIVDAARFFAPPVLTHLYADNYWKELGQALGGLVYLPDVIIEHVHPAAGKAAMDDGYREANAAAVDQADRDAWLAFHGDGRFDAVVDRVRAAYRVTGVRS